MAIPEAKALARKIASSYTPENQPLAFWIFDVDGLLKAAARWEKNMPTVWPQYAIKANPLPHIVKAYGQMGYGYDCASLIEIEEVVNLGFPVERCIFAQPFKTYSQLIAAAKLGVTQATVDSLYEVEKMAKYSPDMGVVVRFKSDDPTATFSLGEKFGLHPEEIEPVIASVKKHGLKMTGIAFHVGCDSHSSAAFREALIQAREVYTLAEKYGFHPTFIDIGGGFSQYQPFEEFAQVIESTIAELKFPEDVHFGAEPGRFFASDCFHLVASIHGKRDRVINNVLTHEYVLGDGIHGALAYCMMFKHQVHIEPLFEKGTEKLPSIFYGPSCNGSDRTSTNDCELMEPGKDWAFIPKVGMYSMAIATNFNGYCCRDHKIYLLKPEDCKLDLTIPEYMEDRNVPILLGRGVPGTGKTFSEVPN